MHLVFFYYERFLFLQNRQHFHKSYDFVLARGSEDFDKICAESTGFQWFRSYQKFAKCISKYLETCLKIRIACCIYIFVNISHAFDEFLVTSNPLKFCTFCRNIFNFVTTVFLSFGKQSMVSER